MIALYSILSFLGIWFLLGIIAIILGYIFLKDNAKKMLPITWELSIVIGFGLASLIWMIQDINENKKKLY